MADVAKAIGYRGASSYQRYEDPELFRKPHLPLDLAEKLARAMTGRGTPPVRKSEVMELAGSGTAARMIPIVGHVGAGAEVIPLDTGVIDEVESPWTELAPEAVAVRVQGDSMAPAYYHGDLIYYERAHADFRHLLGKECVIALSDGRRFVKQLKRTGGGQWFLHSHNADPILGVEIEWAAPVRLIQRAG